MAPVLARLVRLLAGLCLTAAVAIVLQSCVWAVLAFTDVRTHGITALTQPEKVAEAEVERANAVPVAPTIRPVTGGVGPSVPAVGDEDNQATAAEETDAKPASRTSERVLAALSGVASVAGVGAMLLLPLVLSVAFVTTLVRAPNAAGATLGGVLWSAGLVGFLLPWSSWWPQLGWGGLFLSYSSLVAEVEALQGVAGPFGVEPLVVHVVVPALAVAILVGLAWRCGEALHAELLAAESLIVDAATERDATERSARGASMATSRTAAGLSAATGSPLPAVGGTSDRAAEDDSEAPPRRMI